MRIPVLRPIGTRRNASRGAGEIPRRHSIGSSREGTSVFELSFLSLHGVGHANTASGQLDGPHLSIHSCPNGTEPKHSGYLFFRSY